MSLDWKGEQFIRAVPARQAPARPLRVPQRASQRKGYTLTDYAETLALSVSEAARTMGVSKAAVSRARKLLAQ